MKIIKLALILMAFGIHTISYSQKKGDMLIFTGAQSHLNEYHALYILNDSGDKKIKGVIRNINNALEDPRLKGKLKVELVAFGEIIIRHYQGWAIVHP